ncbi:MAG TPA: methylmalonyl-CoA epimerase [Roseiflexaceae bacterium]|nr:methylmalonyl-CoA epimerase [Roseiflexaceae bacterium]
MFTSVDHIGFAVRDIEEAIAFYTRMFEVSGWERMAMPERHMAVAVARVGDTLLELIAPTSDQASFAKFLQERGPSMHHIAYRVDNIEAALAAAAARGIQLIDEAPRPGMHNTLVAFLHPKSTMGVLIELVQHPHRF